MPDDDVEAVLFDLDDTLCEYRRSTPELLSDAFEALGVDQPFTAAEYYDLYAEYIDDSEHMADLRRTCFSELAGRAGYDPDLGLEVAEFYNDERKKADVRAFEEVPAVVRSLSPDYRVGLVTNGSPDLQRDKLARIDLAEAFETEVFAGYDAPAKPAPEPFELALSDLGVPAASAVYVGNSLRTDVSGANAAGMTSVWLSPPDAEFDGTRPDYRIGAIGDLADRPWV